MRQHQARIVVEARGHGLVEITGRVADVVHGTGIAQGLLTLFARGRAFIRGSTTRRHRRKIVAGE